MELLLAFVKITDMARLVLELGLCFRVRVSDYVHVPLLPPTFALLPITRVHIITISNPNTKRLHVGILPASFSIVGFITTSPGWPLFWKTWKCREFCSCQEMSGNWPFVRELSGECHGKNLVSENCYNICMVWV